MRHLHRNTNVLSEHIYLFQSAVYFPLQSHDVEYVAIPCAEFLKMKSNFGQNIRDEKVTKLWTLSVAPLAPPSTDTKVFFF